MKKIVSVLILGCMLFAFAACTENDLGFTFGEFPVFPGLPAQPTYPEEPGELFPVIPGEGEEEEEPTQPAEPVAPSLGIVVGETYLNEDFETWTAAPGNVNGYYKTNNNTVTWAGIKGAEGGSAAMSVDVETAIVNGGTKALRLGTDTSGNATVTTNNAVWGEQFRVTADIYMDTQTNSATSNMTFGVYSGNTAIIDFNICNNSQIRSMKLDGTGGWEQQPANGPSYTVNKWFTLTLVVNQTAGEFVYYVTKDGNTVYSEAYKLPAASLNEPANCLKIDGAKNAIVDNIKIEALSICGVGATSQTTYLSENFEDATVWSDNPTVNGNAMLTSKGVEYWGVYGTVSGQASPNASTVKITTDGSNKVLQLGDSTASGALTVRAKEAWGDKYTVSFDFKATAACQIGIGPSTGHGNGILANDFYAQSVVAINFADVRALVFDANKSGGAGYNTNVASTAGIVNSEWITVKYEFDHTAKTVTLSYTKKSDGSTVPFTQITEALGAVFTREANAIRIQGSKGNYIDNINVYAATKTTTLDAIKAPVA